ncbi:VOC family protein [Cryobacterium sp. TMT4-31]|uniref:VOC family protein n=1 Tax=Cryobacterium sp. TMT4-31 TaxID=1259259 RepID=UPI001069F05F|nr:VOC family protein [Cryobacterium sp. TMT4-31]TFC91134.1 VOC family protein [Cryobacterium sp. TMT4-31]
MKIRSIRIVTADVAASANLFAQLLGQQATGYPDYMEVPAGGIALAFCTPAALATATPELSDCAPGAQILEFDVDDLDLIEHQLEDSVDVIQHPTTQPWGNRSMIVRTDNGTLVNFFMPAPGVARTWPSQT